MPKERRVWKKALMRAASKFRSQKWENNCRCQLGEVCWHVKVIHMLKNFYSHTCSQGSSSSNSKVKHTCHGFGHMSFQCLSKAISMNEKDIPKRSKEALLYQYLFSYCLQ